MTLKNWKLWWEVLLDVRLERISGSIIINLTFFNFKEIFSVLNLEYVWIVTSNDRHSQKIQCKQDGKPSIIPFSYICGLFWKYKYVLSKKNIAIVHKKVSFMSHRIVAVYPIVYFHIYFSWSTSFIVVLKKIANYYYEIHFYRNIIVVYERVGRQMMLFIQVFFSCETVDVKKGRNFLLLNFFVLLLKLCNKQLFIHFLQFNHQMIDNLYSRVKV